MTNRFTCRACLLALLPLLTPAAFAARECNFKETANVILNAGSPNPLPVTGTVSEPKLLLKDLVAYDGDGIKSGCSVGPDGQNLHARTNLQDVKDLPGVDGVQFKTNIPGIVYNVHIQPVTTTEVDGYLPPSSDWQQVVAMPGNMDDENGPLDGKKWRVFIDIYQDADYRGNNGNTLVHPLYSTKLGDYRLGGAGPLITINSSTGSFGIPINTPTCESAVTSVSNNTVDFGDINIGDAAGGRVPEKPFSITLSDCSLLNSVTTRLTTALVNGGGNMMANALTGQNVAAGVGVQIRDNYSNTLRPNDANSTAKMTNLAMPGTVKFDFTAQLREDGSPVKPGAFQATGTFNITYQ